MIRFDLAVIAGLLLVGSARAADPPKVADLVRQLETGAAGERVIAAERLGDLGPAAAEAIPALTRTARAAYRESFEGDAEGSRAGRHLYNAALDALVGIGPKAVPALIELLPDEKGDRSGRIIRDLRSLGKDAAPAAPALAKLLADEDQDYRVMVAGILEAIGPGAEPAIPDLVALFFNPKNKNDNRWASGPLPPPPRVAAVRALVRIGPKAAPVLAEKVLPVLAEELKTGEYRPGGSPTEVLDVLGELGGTLVPAVIANARNKDNGLDWKDAGQALLGLGATGRREFGELLTSIDIEVRRELVVALDRYLWYEHYPRYDRFDALPLDITPFIPALVSALKDPEPDHRLAAAQVLSNRGDKVPREVVDAIAALFAVPAVKKFAETKDGYLLSEPRFVRFGETGVRALVALLDSDSTAVRKLAVRQLNYSSRQWSAGALPRLRKLADDPDSELALNAAYAAARLSLDPKDAALLVTRRFIRSPDPEIRAKRGQAPRLARAARYIASRIARPAPRRQGREGRASCR